MCMVSFGGVAVLTTNALGRMDTAALRRCDLKIELAYLRVDQRMALWTRVTGMTVDVRTQEHLKRLSSLTPGDFAAVAAQAQLIGGRWDAEEWLRALEKEHVI